MVDVNGDTSVLDAQVAQPNSGLGTVGVPAPPQSLNQVFTSHFLSETTPSFESPSD